LCEGGLKKPRTPQHDLAKNFFVGRIFLARDFLEENVWAEFFVSVSEANSKLLMLFFLKWVVVFHHLQTEEKEEEKKTSNATNPTQCIMFPQKRLATLTSILMISLSLQKEGNLRIVH